MKIGVDAHVLSGKYQGSRTYLYNLYQAILEVDCSNEYFFFGHWQGQAPLGNGVEHIEFSSASRWKRLTYQTSPLVKRLGIDLYHSTFISPLLLPCKSLLTIHDVLFETHPHFFEAGQRLRNRLLVRHSAGRAAQIHTVSEFSRQSVIDIYGLPPRLVKVVPNGVDLHLFNPDGRAEAVASISARYGIKDYLLTVGRLEPRKNHVGLLRAYELLRRKMPGIGPLVIVGQKDFGYQDFFRTLHESGLEDVVIVLHEIDDFSLSAMYRASRLFVYPTFAEGFGIPPLEAMACGVPVITSNATTMPEIVGDAALLIDPGSIDEICNAMHLVLTNQDLAANLSLLGRGQAEKWTWKKAAESYLAALASMD